MDNFFVPLQKNLFERNPKKTILFFVIFITVIFDFALGKIFIPVTQLVRNAYYHHDLKRNFKGRLYWGNYPYDIYTNSLAFKDKSRRKIKVPGNKYRIVFIGDSFTEGVRLPYEKTFVGIIDEQLNKDGFEVFNAGVSSFSPKLYFLKIKDLIERVNLKFNELYVFIDISDIQDEIGYENYIPSDKQIMVRLLINTHVFFKQNSFIYYSLHELYRKRFNERDKFVNERTGTWLNNAKYYEERMLWTKNEEIFDKWGRRGLKLAEANTGNLYELCRKNRIKMAIVVYPWPLQIKNRELNSKQAIFWQEFCKKRNINFINYFPDFINDSDPERTIDNFYLKEDVHFNENGHKLIAEKWLHLYGIK